MTYHELKIALDINDPKAVLSKACKRYHTNRWLYVADDGNCHLFDKDGHEQSTDEMDVIPDSYFKLDSTLKTIILPSKMHRIGVGAFSYCESLQSITIPNSVKSVGSYAFANCCSLKKVVVGNGITTLSWSMFENCINLKDISLPDSISTIAHWAFANCGKIKSISIGSNVEEIGVFAFSACTGLKQIFFKGRTMEQVKDMKNYPWGIPWRLKDMSIIQVEL